MTRLTVMFSAVFITMMVSPVSAGIRFFDNSDGQFVWENRLFNRVDSFTDPNVLDITRGPGQDIRVFLDPVQQGDMTPNIPPHSLKKNFFQPQDNSTAGAIFISSFGAAAKLASSGQRTFISPAGPEGTFDPPMVAQPGELIGSQFSYSESIIAKWFNAPGGGADETEDLLGEGFIAVEIDLADGTHYGWIEIQLNDSFNTVEYDNRTHLYDPVGWAYETRPGVPIMAGAIPEPSSAVAVILGWWCIPKRRRCRG